MKTNEVISELIKYLEAVKNDEELKDNEKDHYVSRLESAVFIVGFLQDKGVI